MEMEIERRSKWRGSVWIKGETKMLERRFNVMGGRVLVHMCVCVCV